MSEWIPIESAPTGEPIMITDKDSLWVATGYKWFYEDADGHSESYCSVVHYNGTILVPRFYATHYQPLPAPPEGKKER